MKTPSLHRNKFFNNISSGFAASCIAAFFTFGTQVSDADIPDRHSSGFAGMYKVAASNDPIFPMSQGQEWFLDFGTGIQQHKVSGNVAVSLRQNPNVSVRIMAWQFFPAEAALAIGNPYSEGSRNAVAKGVWAMGATDNGVIFQRGNYQVVLHPAAPSDY